MILSEILINLDIYNNNMEKQLINKYFMKKILITFLLSFYIKITIYIRDIF